MGVFVPQRPGDEHAEKISYFDLWMTRKICCFDLLMTFDLLTLVSDIITKIMRGENYVFSIIPENFMSLSSKMQNLQENEIQMSVQN